MAGSILLEEGVITSRYALAVMSFHRGAVVGRERGNSMRTLWLRDDAPGLAP